MFGLYNCGEASYARRLRLFEGSLLKRKCPEEKRKGNTAERCLYAVGGSLINVVGFVLGFHFLLIEIKHFLQ